MSSVWIIFNTCKYLATISPYLRIVEDKHRELKPVFQKIAIRIMEVYEEEADRDES